MTRLAVAILLAVMLTAGQAHAATLALKAGGSTVLASLFRLWMRDYIGLRPGVVFSIADIGSHRGTVDALAGALDIGLSDTFMSDAEAQAHPGFVNIALANSAVAVVTAVPELTAPLKLDGPTLAAIYRGAIRSWDDRAIAELNPEAALPHREIVPVQRAEGAAETRRLCAISRHSAQRGRLRDARIAVGLAERHVGVADNRPALARRRACGTR